MNFADCLKSAVEQGALQADEAAQLRAAHDAEVTAARVRGDADPEASAKAALEKELSDKAAQALRTKALQAEKIADLATLAQEYRNASGSADVRQLFEGVLENRNNILAGAPSVVGRREAMIAFVHGRLEQMLYETRRGWATGARKGELRLENMAHEAFGKATGDSMATDFLAAWRKVDDELIDQFNAMGGQITKRANYFPNPQHQARKFHAAGKDKMIADYTAALDIGKMKDPLTGGALTPERLKEALGRIYDRVVTDGKIDQTPSSGFTGMGTLASRRQEERFLEFKSGDDWLAINNAYGNGDLHATLMGHLHGLAKDVATLDILGPNPDATLRWMSGVLQQEKARADLGQPSLYKNKTTEYLESDPAAFMNRMWDVIDGNLTNPNLGADAVAGLRNVLTAAQLSSTALTALAGDPAQMTWARQFAGVPAFRFIADLPRQLFASAGSRDISRSGIIVADAMEHLRTDVGGYGLTAASNEMARWLPDRVFTWTGLTPWTNASRRAHAQAFMFHAGDLASDTLAAMTARGGQDARFARWLEGFGIGETEWAVIGQARPLDHGEAGGMLRPIDVIDSGLPGARDIGLRYSEAIHALMEEATPQGTARTRTILGHDTKKGTTGGEVVRSGTMYLTYPSTVMVSLINAASHEASGGPARGIGFAMKTAFTLSLGGAAILQMQALRQGRDARGIDEPLFWAEALVKGGGLGFYGDWALADYKRGGGETAAKIAGPVAGFGADLLAVANPKGIMGDDETNRAERAVQLMRRNTPVINMWPVKPFADRILFDRLQAAANPDVHDSWRRRERQLMKETGQGTWWRRGEALPDRAPDLSLW